MANSNFMCKVPLVDDLVILSIWDDVIAYLIEENKINKEEYEADPKKWVCPFLVEKEPF